MATRNYEALDKTILEPAEDNNEISNIDLIIKVSSVAASLRRIHRRKPYRIPYRELWS